LVLIILRRYIENVISMGGVDEDDLGTRVIYHTLFGGRLHIGRHLGEGIFIPENMGHDPIHDLACGRTDGFLPADHGYEASHLAGSGLAPAIQLSIVFAAGGPGIDTGIAETMGLEPGIDRCAASRQALAPDGSG